MALGYIDTVTSSIFIIECAMKIYALGFLLNGKKSYLRNPWNVLDFIIVVLSAISMSSSKLQLHMFKMFRIARLFRLV
jgi:Ion transport protein